MINPNRSKCYFSLYLGRTIIDIHLMHPHHWIEDLNIIGKNIYPMVLFDRKKING